MSKQTVRCEDCGEEIGEARLRAAQAVGIVVRRCIGCQERADGDEAPVAAPFVGTADELDATDFAVVPRRVLRSYGGHTGGATKRTGGMVNE